MRQVIGAVVLILSMSAAASADIIPNEPETRPNPRNAQLVSRQLEKIGVSSTEALAIAGKLTPDQLQFLAQCDNCNTTVGALLPEEWLGAALWFYVTVPYIEKNIRKYLFNQSFQGNEWFNWKPFDF